MHHSKNTNVLQKISERIRKNKVVIVLVVITILIGCYFLRTKAHTEVEPHLEESYTLKSDAPPIRTPANVSVGSSDDKKELPESKEVVAARVAYILEKQQQLQQRLSAPLMLVSSNTKENVESAIHDDRSKDANLNTKQDLSKQGVQTATADVLGSLDTIVASGNFIHAILESATNSDLPGSLRAIVSESIYSEDGSNVLIPRGSRLIGEYKSGTRQGQSRIFIIWQRLITPEGVSVQLESSGVDRLGVSGMGADSINHHFWERFGSASLLSLISAGSATLGASSNDPENSVSSYRTAISNSFSQSASQSLQQDSMIGPTLKTVQGKPIIVFVAKDLQFQNAIKSIKPSINIF